MGSSKYKGSGLKGLRNLNSVKDVGSLLRQLNISPVKALGQNFLRDDGESQSIVESLNCNGDDIVIEIGPGLGALTQYLFGKVKKLILIEFDKNIAELLAEIFGNEKRTTELLDKANELLLQDAFNADFHDPTMEEDLVNLNGITNEVLSALSSNNIKKLEDLAEMSVGELQDISETISEKEASALIMEARKPWFE